MAIVRVGGFTLDVYDGLFALTARYLEVEFDYIITAEQAGTYKPSPNNFELALKRIGAAPEKIRSKAKAVTPGTSERPRGYAARVVRLGVYCDYSSRRYRAGTA